jgi:hypothetical protein
MLAGHCLTTSDLRYIDVIQMCHVEWQSEYWAKKLRKNSFAVCKTIAVPVTVRGGL